MIIAVSSRSFAKNKVLRDLLKEEFPHAKLRYTSENQEVLDADQLSDLCDGADYLIVGRERIDSGSIKRIKSIRGISKYGVGLDNIDFSEARSAGIKVEFEKGVNAWEVTELTICLMLSCMRKVALSDRLLHSGKWHKDGGTNLSGKSVGVIGFGHIGSRVAKLLMQFGCHVFINDILDKNDLAHEIGVVPTTKDHIYQNCDIISLHVPLTTETHHLIDESVFEKMKHGSNLINTARGALVEEKALIKALKNGKLRSAGMDVYEQEPLTNQKLYTLDNFVGTAHIGGSSKEASIKMGKAAIRGLKRIILDKLNQE